MSVLLLIPLVLLFIIYKVILSDTDYAFCGAITSFGAVLWAVTES